MSPLAPPVFGLLYAVSWSLELVSPQWRYLGLPPPPLFPTTLHGFPSFFLRLRCVSPLYNYLTHRIGLGCSFPFSRARVNNIFPLIVLYKRDLGDLYNRNGVATGNVLSRNSSSFFFFRKLSASSASDFSFWVNFSHCPGVCLFQKLRDSAALRADRSPLFPPGFLLF